MNALIGHTGFIGSNLIEHLDEKTTKYYNSKNIEEIKNENFDTVYCCGLYAEKWKINQNPIDDLSSIKNLQNLLKTISCKTFILISTVDIFNCDIIQNEDDLAIRINSYAQHSYGKHRFEMEQFCKTQFSNTYIFRLPALFGKGLKKNALFDMLNNNNVHLLCSHWKFQWYNVSWLYEDMMYFINKNIREVNFVLESISLKLIQTLFLPNVKLNNDYDKKVNYKLISKYFKQKRNLDELLISMKEFIENYKKNTNLLVSELAWPKEYDFLMETFLRLNNIDDLEAVPSKRNYDLSSYKSIYSMQSLLYNNNINIFKQQEEFINIINSILEKNSDVKVLIFGSPKNRTYNNEECITMFKIIADLCSNKNVVFCIEHNSSKYDCNWMTTFKDVYEFVKTINHPNIKVNLDIGNLIMEDEILEESFDIDYIGHIQLSFPYLSYYDDKYNNFILQILKRIKSMNYQKKISLEMKYSNKLPFKQINSFIELMNQV
jgi:hypothetical protein